MSSAETTIVSALYIYPIKSCAGIEVGGIRFDSRGPQFDRRFMIIDLHGHMVTQRELPGLCQIAPTLLPTALGLRAPGMVDLNIPLNAQDGQRTRARVWKHETEAIDQGEDAAGWLSELLGLQVRLVRWAEDMPRLVNRKRTQRNVHIAFADAYPALLLSEASLKDLNSRLKTPVTMARFRPNIVLSGCDAYAEDHFQEIALGELGMDLVKPCERCIIVNVDPISGDKSNEPLKTLASYRMQGNKVVFGRNGVHHGFGTVRVGDSVTVSE